MNQSTVNEKPTENYFTIEYYSKYLFVRVQKVL